MPPLEETAVGARTERTIGVHTTRLPVHLTAAAVRREPAGI